MSETKHILIVDDEPKDQFMIKSAVEVCLKFLKYQSKYEFRLSSNMEEGIKLFNQYKPVLLITDLFMPPGGDLEKMEVWTDEMDFPHGLQLLKALQANSGAHKLVTTFFWDYPGFARYSALLEKFRADASLPKDLFYLVGCFKVEDDEKLSKAAAFPPLRILVEALHNLLGNQPSDQLSKEMRYLRFRSLFDESCSWLFAHPHIAVEARNNIELGRAPVDKKRDKVKKHEYIEELSSYRLGSQWMPSFVLEHSSDLSSSAHGLYKTLLKEVDTSSGWAVHMQPSKTIQLFEKEPRTGSLEWNGQSISVRYKPHYFPPQWDADLTVERFLKPPRDNHYAQLLLTLSFFSYWCHTPDHRAARTEEEIAALIKGGLGHTYRKLSENKVEKTIREDLEDLSWRINRMIRTEWHDAWWRYYDYFHTMDVIEKHRRDNNDYRWWLNASLLLQEPRGWTRGF